MRRFAPLVRFPRLEGIRRRGLLLAATIVASGFWVVSPSFAQHSGKTATAEQPAEATVTVPTTGTGALLDVGVRTFRPPTSGTVDFTVTLSGDTGTEQEVGRFSMFPVQPFDAANASEERTFRFDASRALSAVKSDGPIKVRIKIVPMDAQPSPSGAALTIGEVKLTPRS